MSTEHSKRAAKFTQNVEKTTWHDATFWSVRQKRDKMAQELPEWEDLREHASEIKMHTITHLADYLDMFSKNLESRGVKVHWAKDAQEFNEIVLGILKDHNVKKMVKSKSMLTEECEMNPYLEHRTGYHEIFCSNGYSVASESGMRGSDSSDAASECILYGPRAVESDYLGRRGN